jgi:hypothetical protein
MVLFHVIHKHLHKSLLHFNDSIVHPTLDLSLILGLELDPSGFEHYEITIIGATLHQSNLAILYYSSVEPMQTCLQI